MKREEFCELKDKPARENELNALLEQACQETNRPLYVLKAAILKTFPQYRAMRLG